MKKRPILLLISIVYVLIVLFPVYKTDSVLIPERIYNPDYENRFDYLVDITFDEYWDLTESVGDVTYIIRFLPLNGRVNTTYTKQSDGVIYHTHIVLIPYFLHELYEYNDNELVYYTQRNIINYSYFWLSFIILFSLYVIYSKVKRRKEIKEQEIQDSISRGEVTIGMSMEQTIDSLGKPDRYSETTSGKNKSTTKYDYYYEDMTLTVTMIDGIVSDVIRESGN